MVQRRYGPVQGAGVGVQELEGDKPIEAGALGWCGYAGVLEKGDVGKLLVCPTKASFVKKCGGYLSDSLLPDAAFDFYSQAAGAGGLVLVRVTDGNEVQAETNLFCRKTTRTLMGKLKAKNGGRWGGKEAKYTSDVDSAGDILETTLDTGITTWAEDQWKGGWLELSAVSNKRYPILGNTALGVITIASDSKMKTDWGTGPSLRYYLYLENEDKCLSYEIRDGLELPATEFSLYIYVNGQLTIWWENLSINPISSRYWENVINNDGRNDEIVADDLWTGAVNNDVRPANHYGEISTVTETLLAAVVHEFDPDQTGDGNGTCALGTTTDAMVEQTITISFSGPTAFTAVSDKFGSLGPAGTVGTAFTPNNKWSPPFTLTAGTSVWAAADVASLVYKPFVADALIGGSLYPDKVNASREKYRVIDNSHKTITVAAGSDLTASGTTGDQFMVTAPLEMAGGEDGIAGMTDADYENQAWDTNSSPFNQIRGKNLGLVKLATPGVTSTSVQKAGVAYAETKNHQYRYEVPAAKTDEVDVDGYVNDTLGRSEFSTVSFPSYGYVADPEANEPGKLKLVTLTGMIHGREARIANDWVGYHKAEAGVDAVLPSVLKLTTEDAILNEEYLNPKGINVIKKVKGRFVMWGDRTLWSDPAWKWKHQREQMSYYEQVLIENFDWIVFAINDPVTEKPALAALKGFFLPEFQRRALRGKSVDDAAIIKLDSEINTDVTRAAGDMYAEINLALADTVERFIMKIGKQGLFESVG
jgi:hypothetical protein